MLERSVDQPVVSDPHAHDALTSCASATRA